MLSCDESLMLLAEYGKGTPWIKHCLAVADSASMLGRILESRYSIDQHYLRSGAVLHDIGRCITHDPILRGVEGYKLLVKLGYEEEAFVCASHILFGLEALEPEHFALPARNFIPRTIEERTVPLVDFMMEGVQPTTIDRRFSSLRKRYVKNSFLINRLDRAQQRAISFLIQLSEEIGEPVENFIGIRLEN